MERRRGVPSSGWHEGMVAKFNGSKPLHPHDEESLPDDQRLEASRRHIKEGLPPKEGRREYRKAYSPASLPSTHSSPPKKKKIEHSGNVYHFRRGAKDEENGSSDDQVDAAEHHSQGNEFRDAAYTGAPYPDDHEANRQSSETNALDSELIREKYTHIAVEEPTQPEQVRPEWQDHPITRALSALHDPGNPLNPTQVIADSLLPPEARTRRQYQPDSWEEMPVTPIPAEAEAASQQAATNIDQRDAFWDFWLGHQDQMRKQCIRLMAGNIADAEDALSSAMLRAAQKFPNYADSILNGKAWLRKLVYNVCMDHYRQDKMTEYRAFDQDSDIPSTGAMYTEKPQSPEEKALSREQIRNLDECIDGMSGNLRVPLFLRCIEGWSYPDIAAELDLKADTVRKRIQLARDHLRRSNIR